MLHNNRTHSEGHKSKGIVPKYELPIGALWPNLCHFSGIQTRRTVCIRIADDEVVSNGLCDPDEIPEDISQTCRTNPCPEE